ncbi:MAG: DUF4157 domain-containing protein [Bacteroidota bacterium]
MRQVKSSENNGIKKGESFFPATTIYPKLTVNAPNDKYEQEADAMADRVMRMPAQEEEQMQMKPLAEGIQRKCTHCEEEAQRKPLMRKAGGGGMEAPKGLSAQLNNSKGGGVPLPKQTLQRMNRGFGTDFSNVRVHTGSRAGEMSQSVQAKAFTHGSDVYFNRGQYAPGTSSGDKLLAHELTHVVQQGGARNSRNLQLQEAGQSKGSGKNESLLIWINAFIPGHVPGGTEKIKKGLFKGKTCIPAWPFGCALTDNRSFSPSKSAKTRMRFFMLVNLNDLSLKSGGFSDLTHHIDKDSGQIKCRKRGNGNYQINHTLISKDKNGLGFEFTAAGNNPCVPGSPDIDFNGMVALNRKTRRLIVQANLDEFPAFEMYVVSTKTGKTTNIFTSHPVCNDDSNVMCLFGGPQKLVKGSVKF